MESFMKHYGSALLALVTVLLCIYFIFGGFSGEKTGATVRVQYSEIDEKYAKDEMTPDIEGRSEVLAKAAEPAPNSTYNNLEGLYTNTYYNINTLFSAKTGTSNDPITAEIVDIDYVLNDESSGIIKAKAQSPLTNWDVKYDTTPLDPTNPGGLRLLDAKRYQLVEIDDNGTNGKNQNADYADDRIKFNFRGDYIISVYMQGNKRVVRQYDIHILKEPSLNL